MSLEKNLKNLLEQINEAASLAHRARDEIRVVAISKGRSIVEIKEAYFLGIRDFGESRVQEALEKIEQLPSDIRWHFVGKLQKNKVAKVIGRFALIHSVDTPELAQKIAMASVRAGVKTPILLEVNTSGEVTKEGLPPEEWEIKYSELIEKEGIEIQGLMTMAPLTEDEGTIRHCFSELRQFAQRLKERGGDLSTLSMGMSNDFPIAIQEGATLLRIGTSLFMPQ